MKRVVAGKEISIYDKRCLRLSKEEVQKIVTEQFAEVLATKNKGQIMKTVMPHLKGKADGKVINEVITELTK